MDKLKLLLLLLIPISIKAQCTNQELSRYKTLASNIDNYYEYTDKFNITVYNLSNELKVKNIKDNSIYTTQDKFGEIKINGIEPGTQVTLGIYPNSEECNYRVQTIYINLPYLNKYYQDEVCNNNDNILCSKWVNTNAYTYEQFVAQVKKQTTEEIKEPEKIEEKKYGFFDFLGDYYIIILLVIIITGSFGIYRLKKKDSFNF